MECGHKHKCTVVLNNKITALPCFCVILLLEVIKQNLNGLKVESCVIFRKDDDVLFATTFLWYYRNLQDIPITFYSKVKKSVCKCPSKLLYNGYVEMAGEKTHSS